MKFFWAALCCGILSGAGIGGGTLLLPVLTLWLDVGQYQAQYLNLLYFLPTALIAGGIYLKSGQAEWKTVRVCVAWGVPGAIAGSLAAGWVSAALLQKMFSAFLVGMGVWQLFLSKNLQK